MRAPLLSVLAVSVIAVCVASGKPAADLQVTAVRFWSAGDVTRIAIEANGDFTFRRDRLNNPDRLFFDIVGARPNVGGTRFSTRQVHDKFLKQIRIAETQPGRTRIVLDLNGTVEYTVSKLENPDRLMIELRALSPSRKMELDPVPVTANPPLPPPLPITPAPPVMSASVTPSNVPTAVNTVLGKPSRPEVPSVVAATEPTSTFKPTTPISPAVSRPEPPAVAAKKSTSDGSRSLIRALGLKINRVVIDAGHGGHDVGTTGVTGLLEKDLVLDVAMRLGKLIEQRLGAEVIYTRLDDTYVPLEERTSIANRSHADLFLSIHANSSPIKAVAGVETFYLNFTSSADALDVAARENASSHKSVFELKDLIQSISLHDKIEESKEFASNVQRSMQANAVRYISTAKDRGIKRAPFVVLIGAQMPSVLSEIGFISNPREEALLKRGDHRQQIAEALYKGVSRYSESLSHIQVARESIPGATTKSDREVASK
jgi:N-acetylmuramoyl-L-alanine amidase